MKLGQSIPSTHDRIRHDTAVRFAAPDALAGTVLGRCMRRHRHQAFIRFFDTIAAPIPNGKDGPAFLDNDAAHSHAKVRAWFDRHLR